MSGGRRFYSNSHDYLEGVSDGIEYTADSALEVGLIQHNNSETSASYSFILEVKDPDADSWTDFFN